LTDLGIYAERIAARLRAERRWTQLLEAHRLVRLRDEERAGEILERQRLVRREEEGRIAASLGAQRRAGLRAVEYSELRNEQQRVVRLLKEELAYQAMTEAQKVVERFDEQVVSWLSADESGNGDRGNTADCGPDWKGY
jgi:hypothetical protein